MDANDESEQIDMSRRAGPVFVFAGGPFGGYIVIQSRIELLTYRRSSMLRWVLASVLALAVLAGGMPTSMGVSAGADKAGSSLLLKGKPKPKPKKKKKKKKKPKKPSAPIKAKGKKRTVKN
jgi:hypothetical protein